MASSARLNSTVRLNSMVMADLNGNGLGRGKKNTEKESDRGKKKKIEKAQRKLKMTKIPHKPKK